jgi:HK97 gp10 family phage protein
VAGAEIQVTGLKELAKAARAVQDKGLEKAVKAANKTAAQTIVDEALPDVPVGTSPWDHHPGALKATVRAMSSATTARGVAGNRGVPYGPAVHWGTGPRSGATGPHNIKPHPFLFLALQRFRLQAGAVYSAEMDKVLEEHFTK